MLNKFTDFLDKLIDSITMYRLLLYYLLSILALATIFSTVHIIHYNPLYIILSAVIFVIACYLINKILAVIFSAPANPESSIITALILALIIEPKPTGYSLLFILAASGLAMASKYLLTRYNQNIFNPAALAVFLTAIGPHQSANWWVGTASLAPFVFGFGVLVVRKIHREKMVGMFYLVAIGATIIFSLFGSTSLVTNVKFLILDSAVLFLGVVMLTEPYTSPNKPKNQLIYAAIVGLLLAPQFHIGHLYPSPEFALLVGNLLVVLIEPKVKLYLTLKRKYVINDNSVEFEFAPNRPLKYLPGQYMELTLPHERTDQRGSRRFLSLSSSPTEPYLKFAARFYDESSSFKASLIDIDQNTIITAGNLAGQFTLPEDTHYNLCFIAGGIGITPYKSMLQYIVDKNLPIKVSLIYLVPTIEDIAYKDFFDKLNNSYANIAVYYIVKQPPKDKKDLAHHYFGLRLSRSNLGNFLPVKQANPHNLMFYLSGSRSLVVSMREILFSANVSEANIKQDYFSGYSS